jgi:hypothetical protein
MNTIIECPGCKAQLSVKLSFASGPRVSQPTEKVFADTRDVGELLEAVNLENCSEWERTFVEETKERYAKYKDRLRMSDKQLNILHRIAEKGF